MTSRRPASADLPHWPRWLTKTLAAAYVGVSVNQFWEEMKAGVWPQRHPKLRRWDRAELDRASDRLSNSSTSAKERMLRRIRHGKGDADAIPA